MDKFVDFESPKVKSSGNRVVLTATFNPSRSIGGLMHQNDVEHMQGN